MCDIFEVGIETERELLKQLIREQVAFRYAMQRRHAAYSKLESGQRKEQLLNGVESQLVECETFIESYKEDLAKLTSGGES